MYLSKIEIFGFKSFAQSVNLTFDSGITAIVGPNGCGKTNIVDAIRWALGEQRYSTLRSDKMEDVIFNGTKNRKPLGMAEVSIVIENTKGILPTEYSQVTVTRRVYRSGESEYLLNKVPCRLKDILDLFMDTGMGADAYSVIELKMVETILSDKTDERRRLFEEAAGVTKYKHRRKAAYNKLESVQQDLMRVNDIVKEVQKTVNALERQSKKAEQYNELSQKLRELEIDLLEHEYAYLHKKLIPLQEKFNQTKTEKEKIEKFLLEQDNQIDQMRLEVGDIEHKLNELLRETSRITGEKHKIEELIIIGNQKIDAYKANIERYEKEKIDLQNQQHKLEENKSRLLLEISNNSTILKNVQAKFENLQNEFNKISNELNSKESQLQNYNNELISLIHEIAQKNGEKQLIEEKIENIRRLIERAQEDSTYFENEIHKCEKEVAELTSKDKLLHKEFAKAELEQNQIEEKIQQLKSELEELQTQELNLRNELNRISTRIEFITGLVEKKETHQAVAFLINDYKKFPIVADLINTEPKYRLALQTALGEAANYIVVQDENEALEAANFLEKHQKGKAVFICLNRIPQVKRLNKLKKNTFLWADQVIRVDEPYRELVNYLLENVVIVDDINKTPDSLLGVTFVSIDGSIKTTGGIIRAGSNVDQENLLIGKNEMLEQLNVDKNQLNQQIAEIQIEKEKKEKEIEALNLKLATEEVKSIEKEMASVERQIAQYEYEKSRAQNSLDRIKEDLEELKTELTTLETSLNELLPTIKKLDEDKISVEAAVTKFNNEIKEIVNSRNELAKEINETEINLINIQNTNKNLELEFERDNQTIENIILTLQIRDEEIKNAHKEIERIAQELQENDNKISLINENLNRVEQEKQTVEQNYNNKRSEIHRIELKLKDDRRTYDDYVGKYYDLEMKIHEVNQNLQHIIERAKNEFEIEIQLKEYPEDEWVDFAAKREEVRQIKERLKMLGAINFAAFDEYKSESERLTFMTQQRDDLIEAERTLINTIEEINNTAQKKFLDTFEKIRENFIKTFKSLFDEGDECDLRLEEGQDPLEARIEIIAKPRGKRPTSIDLLSGGEKTLTAIALLFAIYLVKPSPFCILDEVDAPLDDSNIDRFTRILKKFSDNTQFIVVTHNKRTMESANAIYGVTMEEEGVSKIVTVRFNEEEKVRSASVATGF